MTAKQYLILVDYGQGGYGFLVNAHSKSELEDALQVHTIDKGIAIIDQSIEEHPLVKYLGERIRVYDLANPQGQLKSLISSG